MTIPGWLGPVIGPLVGALAYLRVTRKTDEPVDVGMLAAFAGVGLFAGALLWFVDWRRKPKNDQSDERE